jgi:hypothetical protein
LRNARPIAAIFATFSRLSSAEYVSGRNAEVWRDYFWREIRRGREIVRLVRHVTTLRGKRYGVDYERGEKFFIYQRLRGTQSV